MICTDPNVQQNNSTEEIDLGLLLSPLSRDDLELLVVKLISQQPEQIVDLLRLCCKPIDITSIISSIQSIITCFVTIPSACNEFEPLIERCNDYSNAQHSQNAFQILIPLTEKCVEWTLIERKGMSIEDEEDDDDSKALQGLFTLLENAWQQAIDCSVIVNHAKQISVHTATSEQLQTATQQQLFAQLTNKQLSDHISRLSKWKNELTPLIGPIFSDAIRSAKKKQRKDIHAIHQDESAKRAKV